MGEHEKCRGRSEKRTKGDVLHMRLKVMKQKILRLRFRSELE